MEGHRLETHMDAEPGLPDLPAGDRWYMAITQTTAHEDKGKKDGRELHGNTQHGVRGLCR